MLTALHSAVACACLGYVAHKNGTLPEALTLGGLGAFATIHYAVNATRNAVTAFAAKQ